MSKKKTKTPQQAPKRMREANEPDPESMPKAPDGREESPSRVESSQEPSESEEKRRVAKKLDERERGS